MNSTSNKRHVIVYSEIPEQHIRYLSETFKVTKVKSVDEFSHYDLNDAVALLGVGQKIDSSLLDATPRLKVISTISVGYDCFDVPTLTERGIILMHTPDVLTESVADLMMLLVMSAARRITELTELIRNGKWRSRIGPKLYGVDVHEKEMGIIGMGRIGYALAKRAYSGFNMKILYHSRSQNQQAEDHFKALRVSLDHLLAQSDFVCITVPLNHNTEKLIGTEQFNTMKSSAFLINGSRAKIVDEHALIDALYNCRICGAALDVYHDEPIAAGSPLLKMPNVFALPHVGSATHETRQNMIRCAIENLEDGLENVPTKNCVNPQAYRCREA